ncbi:uncharacterized protein LOC107495508 [Arachis duranensis]|uniref:Uncharacterized protein LOC107495508 n=1 Tax=Arachis duranensis TaxID=130453 RepID=A0A6P4DWT3_ARADU|nr:uncharacterized protein LOC107495508 [Arachis duranensis]
MAESIFLLLYHRKKIDENTSESVTFSSKGVFITPSTTLMDLHSSILEKAGKCSKKRVKQLFFRIPISLKQGYVKYGKYAMLGDDDMRVIFHSQARFSDLGALELFAIMVDVEGSNGGSAPNMPTGVIEGTSTAIPTGQPATPLVLFPSFAADLPVPGDDLGDGRSFGQLAAAIGSAPVVDSAPAFMEVRERDPFAEAIGDDGSDSEPPIIGDESDGEENTAVAGGAQTHGSSGTQQYPRHFTTLDLEAVNQAANVDQHHPVIHGERPSVIGTDEFEVGQRFETKEEAVLTIKSYNIQRGVEYKVFESDQLKYHGKCIQFGNGCNNRKFLGILSSEPSLYHERIP